MVIVLHCHDECDCHVIENRIIDSLWSASLFAAHRGMLLVPLLLFLQPLCPPSLL